MNRGSYDRPNPLYPGRVSFNEAPIHESGKFRIVSPVLFDHRASMRPRFMNRGSSKPSTKPSDSETLQ